MFSVNPHPPTRGREKEGKGRETYKWNIRSFTNNTNNTNSINNKRYNVKYTKSILSFPELGALGAGIPPTAAGQYQAVPDWHRQQTGTGLRDTEIGIWIRLTGRTTSRVLFSSQPWMKRARPSLFSSSKLSMTCMAWNTSLVNIGSPVLSAPPPRYDLFGLLTCGT